MAWQRARRPEQKEERRESLLRAAAELFDEEGLDGVSLNAIARRSGISKGNIYRYFESREDIFLNLFIEDFREWVAAMERSLAPLAGSGDIEGIATIFADILAEHSRFSALQASMASVVERNVSTDRVAEFKTGIMADTIRLANAVHAAIPALTIDATRQFIMYSHLLAVGMWPAAHPSSSVQKALHRPELQMMCVDYESDMKAAIIVLLQGLTG